jgi:glycosyltransferase involved in cell wall biosynthesis
VRVGVDGRSLVGGTPRGVAHYTSALLGALAAQFPGDEWRVLLPRGPVRSLPAGVTPVRSALPSRLLFGLGAVARRPRLEQLLGAGCDVLWTPAPAPVAVGPRMPLVLTIHDRSWELRPSDFTRYERAWHRLARPRALARRAQRVLCVSDAVRRDVVAAWGLDGGRVLTARPAPRAAEAATVAPGERPYFLFAGALEPRKAPEVLAAAHERARARGLAADVVFAGGGRLAGRVAGPGRRVVGHVGNGGLDALYAGALAVVLPSHLEGFGLPPVEALARGTPAIVSELPVFREVLGDDGAVFVAPGDVESLARALLAVERDASLRERLVSAGRRSIAGLSWEDTARRTRAALAEAAA